MDGVVVDLLAGWMEHHKLTLPNPYPFGKMAWPDIFGISTQEIWTGCDAKFWAELPPTEFGLKLVTEAERIFGAENVFLVTSVVAHSSAAEGKLNWIAKHCPAFWDRYLITHAKHILSYAGVVLVDDDPKSLPKFAANGGHTILHPTIWNHRHADAPRSIHITLDQLAFLARSEQENRLW